jgi:opacity protein-like surface antigen
MGTNVSRNFSFQIESSFIWHFNGRVDPKYETGTFSNNTDYIDRYDNSTLIAVPIIASVKVYPFGRNIASFYLSGGYGIQYTKESVDRVREVYDYSYSGFYNSSTLYEYTLAQYWDARWFHGFKTAIGVSFNLQNNISGDVELRFTNFYPTERNNASPLSMFRTPNLGNIALSTKIYFGF